MNIEYEDVSPYRIQAFGEYYSTLHTHGQIFKTIEETIKYANKGHWICSVSLFGKILFYTIWKETITLKKGAIIGKWNELTLIKKKDTKP